MPGHLAVSIFGLLIGLIAAFAVEGVDGAVDAYDGRHRRQGQFFKIQRLGPFGQAPDGNRVGLGDADSSFIGACAFLQFREPTIDGRR